MVRMLEEDDPSSSTNAATDTPVTLSDQNAINQFSRLNSRTDEILEELEGLSKVKEDYEEVQTELELLDDDEEPIMYKLDSTFLHLPVSEALEHLQASLERTTNKIDSLEKEKDECEQGMEDLKKVLYEKFGNSINLERGD
ncbi:tubulin-binding prefolding complex subunit GIM3 [Sporobolomyces koalae]|uniref:tubulin-binding prefolding complex subunit GIM3 n=1 Tax=Sporobolomyces koalae TaxID=500713 RepID=UPI00317933D1